MDPVFYDFCDKLRAGKYDDSIETMKNLLNERKTKLAQLNGTAMVPDSHVVIVGDIRPVYLVGHIAKVVKVNKITVSVSFLQPIYGTGGRARPIKDCTVPLTCVKSVPLSIVNAYVKNIKVVKGYGPTAVRQNRWDSGIEVTEMSEDSWNDELSVARAEASGS